LRSPSTAAAEIKVEVCRICEFVWFDVGETQTLPARPLPKPKPQVVLPQEAREAIALAKVQQLAEQARGSDFDSAPPDEWWKSIAAFFGMPVEFDAPAKKSRPAVTWFLAGLIVTASVHAFFHFAGGCPTFRINSCTSVPAARLDLYYLIFSSCRNHSSRRQHVFPSRFWR
jgi:Zn-finger nucleic acid-binding protein